MNTTPLAAATHAPSRAADVASTPSLPAEARDRLYAECARAISDAGTEREALFLSRLALLLFEAVADEARCRQAIADAMENLPQPSLSKAPGEPSRT